MSTGIRNSFRYLWGAVLLVALASGGARAESVPLKGAVRLKKEVRSEPEPLPIRKAPSVKLEALRTMTLPAPLAPLGERVQGPVTVTSTYSFENTAQAMAPGVDDKCPAGRLVVSGGQNDRVAWGRDLIDNAGKLNTQATTAQVPFPSGAGESLGTDNLLLKLKDGSLLALRNGVTSEDVSPHPAWWDKVTIQGSPHGARVGVFVWRSTDCGKSWTRLSIIDPLRFEDGRYAVPRPTEAGCPSGCYGGWDRTEGYADPWTGALYVTVNAVGGPIIDYATGKEKQGRAVTHFLFQSTDGGQTWKSLRTFGAWTPITISSTPNGRVYLYSVIGSQPSLSWSLLNSPGLQFTDFKPIYAQVEKDGKKVEAGVDADYGSLVYKATNSISRVSTDKSSSKVRLTYPYVDGNGRAAVAVVKVEVTSESGDPVVTPLSFIQASSSSLSVLASTFVEPDPAGAQAGSNTSMLYWAEGSSDASKDAVVRYSLFRGEGAGTAPVKVGGPFKPTVSQGHYMYSGSYFPKDGSANFVAQWVETGGLRASVITVPPEPGPIRYDAVWSKDASERPAVWGWARADFDKKTAELQAQGFRLRDVNAFVLPGAGERYNAVWEKVAEARPAVWGWAKADFDKRQAELQAQGFRLMVLNAFVLPGAGERYNAIWQKGTGARPAVWGWAKADFDKKAAALQGQGFRLLEVNAFVLPEGERYNGVWEKVTEVRAAVWGWARADFDKKAAALQGQGFRLLDVNAFVLPGAGERYNAVWAKSSESQPAVWGWARWDLDQRQAELGAQGLRILRVNGFVLP